ERGDADGGGKVSVGAAAGRSFFKFEADFRREFACLLEKGDRAGLALHRRAVDAAGDFEFAGFIGDAEVSHEARDNGRVAGPGDADVHLRGAFGGDDVGARAAVDDTDVDGA